MKNNIITFDLNNLKKLKKEGEKIVLEPDAEDILDNLLTLKNEILEIEELIKDKLKQEALKRTPDFKGIKSEKIVIRYSAGGAKYLINEDNIHMLSSNLYEKKVIYKANSKEVDKYIEKNNGKIPLGINENPAKENSNKKISFYFKKSFKK